MTPRFLNTSGSYFGLEFPPGRGRHVAEPWVRSRFVVVLNPGGDRRLCFFVGFEAVLPDALELERPHERFGDAVLLRRVRQNELLMQAVRSGQIAIQL